MILYPFIYLHLYLYRLCRCRCRCLRPLSLPLPHFSLRRKTANRQSNQQSTQCHSATASKCSRHCGERQIPVRPPESLLRPPEPLLRPLETIKDVQQWSWRPCLDVDCRARQLAATAGTSGERDTASRGCNSTASRDCGQPMGRRRPYACRFQRMRLGCPSLLILLCWQSRGGRACSRQRRSW